MLTETEKSLFECCQWCKVATLPEPWDNKSVWITSIARVRKNNGVLSYAYCERAKDGKPRIMRDFGPVRVISEIEEYFPLIYLDSSYVKKFKKDEEGTEKLIAHLKKEGVSIDFENATRKDLDKENIKVAIKNQLADEKKKSKLIIKD